MPAESFFDASVLLYLVGSDDCKAETADRLLRRGGVISAQVLNEFANVSRRKLAQDWSSIHRDLQDIRSFCSPVLPITLATHKEALRIAERFGYRIYDSLLIAAAIDAGCTTLYSEGMHHGQTIGSLTIHNPFATT